MTTHRIAGGRLDLDALARLTARPALFAPHEALFWNDPYIAKQMLAAHLDPTTDAASHRPETIDRRVEWLVSAVGLAPAQRAVDFGCGPGLYCQRLARRGLGVLGVDWSEGSLEYARAQAVAEDLPIEYAQADYCTPDLASTFPALDGGFDLATIISYDFGVLSDPQRGRFLANIRRALKPGGRFAFDVFTSERKWRGDGATAWSVSAGPGFWRPGPHVVLEKEYRYPEAKLTQVVVLDADGQATVYRIWHRLYSVESLTEVLASSGFAIEGTYADLDGTPYAPGSPTLAVVARRR